MTARLYANQLRKNHNNFRVHDASDKHNLRLDPNNDNYDPDLSHLNYYQIFNPETGQLEVVEKPTIEHLERLRQYQKDLFDSAFKTSSPGANQNHRNEKNNSRKALQGWIDGAKTTAEEKEFFQMVLDGIEAGQGFENDLIEQFKSITDGVKVSRFNDKIRRLEAISKLDPEMADQRKRRLTTQQTELLFKATDEQGITFTNDEMKKMIKAWQSYFPDYQVLYFSIHHDENPDNPHPHFVVSNYNNKTKQFDLVKKEQEAMARYYRKKHKTDDLPEYLTTPHSQLKEEQQSKLGSLKQDFYFDLVNAATGHKYNFTKRTPEEVAVANHHYEKTKPITKREHNRQRKLQEKQEKQEQQIKEVQQKTARLKKRIKAEIEAEKQELQDERDRVKNQMKINSRDKDKNIKRSRELDQKEQQINQFGSLLDRLSVVFTNISKWVGLVIRRRVVEALHLQRAIVQELKELTPEMQKQDEKRKDLINEMFTAARYEVEVVEDKVIEEGKLSNDLEATRKKIRIKR